MKIEMDLRKNAQQNAAAFFEHGKKAKRKLQGVQKALSVTQSRLEKETKTALLEEEKEHTPEKKRIRKWYEKFHWFFSSDNLLVLGGKDAQSNEQLVKKYMKSGNLYFHADIQGAGHVVVHCERNKAPQKTRSEAAIFAACYSSAWKAQLSSVDVFSALPEQVSKKAPSGESIATGGFMIYGKRDWYRKTPLQLAVGAAEEEGIPIILAGPVSAIAPRCKSYVTVIPGRHSKSDTVNAIRKTLSEKTGFRLSGDELLAALPAGAFDIRL